MDTNITSFVLAMSITGCVTFGAISLHQQETYRNADRGLDFNLPIVYEIELPEPEIPEVALPIFDFSNDLIRPIPSIDLHPERDEIACLALNVYHEARGSTTSDQLGTAHVVLNRVQDRRYPDSVCDVVFQPWQFSWTMDDNSEYPHEYDAWNYAQIVALNAYNGLVEDLTGGATHYHTTWVQPFWSRTGVNRQVIGAHVYMIAQ